MAEVETKQQLDTKPEKEKADIVDVRPFEYTKKKTRLDEAAGDSDEPLVVKGILQRANAQNQNGRVYPKKVLKREVKDYKKLINERRALGELDHPDCVRGSAKILTSRGWISVQNIREDEKVYTLNPNTHEVELQKITKKVDEAYDGKMIRIKGRNIDTMVTPNHRFYLIDRYGDGYFATAQEIHDNPQKHSKSYIPKTGMNGWNGNENGLNGHITLEGVEDELGLRCKKSLRRKYEEDIDVDSSTWMKFLGIFLSDGSSSGGGYSVKLTQKKEHEKERIRELISEFPDDFSWREQPRENGKVDFICHDARLYLAVKPLGDTYSKYVPQYALDSRKELLEDMYEFYRMGDGRDVDFGDYNRKETFSVSKQLVDGFHETLVKIGKSGSRTTQVSKKDYEFAGHTINAKDKKPLHVLHESTTKGVYLDPRHLTVEEVNDFDDRVYCVSVPNETIYLMDQGKAFWSGNSSVVNLKNVSHMVTDVWWKGNDLMGEVKVLDTPNGRILKSLLNDNVNIGISSRGMGSVKEQTDGTLRVGNDFDLIAWDFVSNPSTHGAFMDEVNEGVVQEGLITESRETKKEMDRWKDVNSFASELIEEMSEEYEIE